MLDHKGVVIPKTLPKQALSKKMKDVSGVRRLRALIKRRNAEGRLDEWKCGRVVLGYIEGKSVNRMADELDVTRGSTNRWLRWFNAAGLEELETSKLPARAPR